MSIFDFAAMTSSNASSSITASATSDSIKELMRKFPVDGPIGARMSPFVFAHTKGVLPVAIPIMPPETFSLSAFPCEVDYSLGKYEAEIDYQSGRIKKLNFDPKQAG